MTKADLTRLALELPVDEQLDLAQTLWEHASPAPDFAQSAELKELLEARLLEARAKPEVARNFSEYIDRVVYRGERFLLMKDRRPVAELRPVEAEGPRLRDLPRLLASLPHLGPGDLDAFEADLTGARREMDKLAPRDPWES